MNVPFLPENLREVKMLHTGTYVEKLNLFHFCLYKTVKISARIIVTIIIVAQSKRFEKEKDYRFYCDKSFIVVVTFGAINSLQPHLPHRIVH